MRLKVIFGQRKEEYEGQYGPEALECMSEYDFDENPDWLLDKLKEHQQEKWWENIQIIDIEISQEQVMNILRPKFNNNLITGKVTK